MKMNYTPTLLLALSVNCIAQESTSTVVVPPVRISTGGLGTCPTANMTERAINDMKNVIRPILCDAVARRYPDSMPPPCVCDGPGPWTRIAHLNMSDLGQQCPSGLSLITTPARGCGRSSAGPGTCDSIIFPSAGRSYYRVCGRVHAYQKGSTDAFRPIGSNPGLEDVYLDGVSLTHGSVGSRQHIWSFAAALYETHTMDLPSSLCACSDTTKDWPFQVPSFVGENYFCATGNPGPNWPLGFVHTDILWDGEGCGPTNGCCEFNNPPWFSVTLPQPTTDDLEARVCHDQAAGDEDTIISLIDIYAM